MTTIDFPYNIPPGLLPFNGDEQERDSYFDFLLLEDCPEDND